MTWAIDGVTYLNSKEHELNSQPKLSLSLPISQSKFSLLPSINFLWSLFQEFSLASNDNPLVNNFFAFLITWLQKLFLVRSWEFKSEEEISKVSVSACLKQVLMLEVIYLKWYALSKIFALDKNLIPNCTFENLVLKVFALSCNSVTWIKINFLPYT